MADLETAAEAALARVREFQGHLEKAHGALDALEEEATRLAGDIETDWTALVEAINSLVEASEAQRGTVDQEGQEASDALAAVPGALGAAMPQAQEELQGAATELAGLDGRVDAVGPALTGLAQDLHALAGSVADRARQVEAELEEALNEARDFLGVQVVQDLKSLEQALQQRAMDVESMVTGQCMQTLEECWQDFETKLGELEQLVRENAFEEPAEHVREVMEFSVGECKQAHEAVLDTLAGNVMTLEDDLARLKQSIEQRRAEVDTDRGALEGEVEAAERLALATYDALVAVKALMASYTFVSF